MAYFPGTQSFRQPYPRKRMEQGGDNRRAMTANGLPNIMARGLQVPGRLPGNRQLPGNQQQFPGGWDKGEAWWKGGMPPGLSKGGDLARRPGGNVRRGDGQYPLPLPIGGSRPSPEEYLDAGMFPGRDSGRPIMGPFRSLMPFFPPGQTPPWGGPAGGLNTFDGGGLMDLIRIFMGR